MSDIKFNSLIPELSVSDIEKTKEFYLSLGFEIQYERAENKLIREQSDNGRTRK